MKKLTKKLLELQKQGYESVLISQVLEWIRYFTPVPREKSGKKIISNGLIKSQ